MKRRLYVTIGLVRAIPLLTVTVAVVAAGAQSRGTEAGTRRYWSESDATAIRALLAEGYETSWNTHQPATVATPDKCADDAIFVNTTGGWVKGCQPWAEMLTRLHAPGGRFHEETRRHAVEELRFIRPDAAIAVVRIFDLKTAGAPRPGEEMRGLMVLIKEDGHWKAVANANVRVSPTTEGIR